MIAVMSMTRRHVLSAGAAALTAAATGCGRDASASHDGQTATGGTGGGVAAAATPAYVAPTATAQRDREELAGRAADAQGNATPCWPRYRLL